MQSAESSILDSLSPAGKAALLERSIEKSYSAGEILWITGDEPAGLTLVVDGKIRIVRGTGGRQTVIHTGEAGSTLGEIPFFTRGKYPATAIASEPTRCLVITRAAFDHALRVDPALAYALLARLSWRVEHLVERVNSLSSHGVTERLARYVIERAKATSTPTFSLGMTQGELAEELGSVREVIVRALRQLKESGAINARDRGRYAVGNQRTLHEAAGIDD
jgi:CRP/FNR family cyclic AMP-dependent transcriptional regulator